MKKETVDLLFRFSNSVILDLGVLLNLIGPDGVEKIFGKEFIVTRLEKEFRVRNIGYEDNKALFKFDYARVGSSSFDRSTVETGLWKFKGLTVAQAEAISAEVQNVISSGFNWLNSLVAKRKDKVKKPEGIFLDLEKELKRANAEELILQLKSMKTEEAIDQIIDFLA